MFLHRSSEDKLVKYLKTFNKKENVITKYKHIKIEIVTNFPFKKKKKKLLQFFFRKIEKYRKTY